MSFVWGFAAAYLFTGAAFAILNWRLSSDDRPSPAETAFILLFWPEIVIHTQQKEDDDNDRSGT